MTAKTRQLTPVFQQQYKTNFRNLISLGCSFTYNNSNEHICTWPYYLKDLIGLNSVQDLSMPGSGANQAFHSLIHDVETNPDIDCRKDLFIFMISGAERTDIIADKKLCFDWLSTTPGGALDPFEFNESLATFSIYNLTNNKNHLENLCKQYKSTFGLNGQVLESALKIIAMHDYLKFKNATFLFIKGWDELGFDCIEDSLQLKLSQYITDVKTLGKFSIETNMKEPDGHPSPGCHLTWTQEYLIPLLCSRGYCTELQ